MPDDNCQTDCQTECQFWSKFWLELFVATTCLSGAYQRIPAVPVNTVNLAVQRSALATKVWHQQRTFI